MFKITEADAAKFAVFHTLYTAANIFDRFDWNERVDDAMHCTAEKAAYFVYDDMKIIGGFTLEEHRVSYPFIVTPFRDRERFWGVALDFSFKASGARELFLNEIPEADAKILTQAHGAVLRWSKQRMCRPTEQMMPLLPDGFCFDTLAEADKSEIIEVVYEAHSGGYTSTVGKPDKAEIEMAVERRFALFGQTGTLYMGNTVKEKNTRRIAGVCIAGVYPEEKNYSTSGFATIHQVSVRPEYRRKGIAKAMIQKTIREASGASPVITLGVLVGNPAEQIYEEMGFRKGPSYAELFIVKG